MIADLSSDTILRRNRVLELRVAGLSYGDILVELKKDKRLSLSPGFSENSVIVDIVRSIEEIRSKSADYALEILEIDLLRMENLLMVYYNKALAGDVAAANLTLRIMERRARVLGLDTPRKVEVRDWRSEVIELYKSGKLTRDQIEKELGNELAGKLFESGSAEFSEAGKAESGRNEDNIIEGKLA